ncbi:hypothetical protein SBA1_90056 [Candidatus Sulfotelmatobacter kueseliae]|uniref:Uncharacterized protein n=1 Tax=Candidatus Sulfotelmatobacter kueseliae TaxID=2042962 RepID=A0A2U3LAS1_9BACT|nr:hypothetical protein SBA1_90056 [Candidatus Sulfotelmatobacter kueseliae]
MGQPAEKYVPAGRVEDGKGYMKKGVLVEIRPDLQDPVCPGEALSGLGHLGRC